MKKAFTLVELLVVIGILGILTVTLMVSMSGGTESARAAKCLTNLKNLSSAVQTYAGVNTYYPLAGSIEKLKYDESDGISAAKKVYYERPGWLSWSSQGQYPSGSTKGGSGWFVSAYEENEDVRSHAITNGALWKYLSGNRDIFVCPAHKIEQAGYNPLFTYMMNERFGWCSDGKPKSETWYGVKYGRLANADKILLFAEFQWKDLGDKVSGIRVLAPNSSAGTTFDCVLQYKNENECIGFNHISGKDKVAHVAFADGHTEKLTLPKRGADPTDLTEWLCEGIDVSFDGKVYEKVE